MEICRALQPGLRELRNQYVIAYYPKNQARDGKYRKVEVKLSQPRGVSTLKAHWRQGRAFENALEFSYCLSYTATASTGLPCVSVPFTVTVSVFPSPETLL